jgi:hypothetical protein
MQSRLLRTLLLVLCLGSIAAAAVFIRLTEQAIASRQGALRDVDRFSREAADAVHDLRIGQEGYVAFGQGPAFWIGKVDSTRQLLSGLLTTLQSAASSPAARASLDEAAAGIEQFGKIDARIRGFLAADATLMASDVVFGEGSESTRGLRDRFEQARLADRVAFDFFEADSRQMEVYAAGGATAFGVVVAVLLAFVPLKSTADQPAEAASPAALGLSLAAREEASKRPAPLENIPLREHADDGLDLKPREPAVTIPPEKPADPAMALESVARICTDICRVERAEEMQALMGRAAEVLEASGLVLWVGSASGSDLRPAFAHGYSADIVARIPVVPRSANNAAAAAYRSGTLQLVQSTPGEQAKGAIVAPVLSPDGCIGVLSAEIRGGREGSPAVQSLATIFAAQLASLVASVTSAPEQRATGS